MSRSSWFVAALLTVPAGMAAAAETVLEQPRSPFPGYQVERGALRISVGEIRTIARGPMFPTPLIRLANGTLILTMASGQEHAPRAYLISADLGETWRPLERAAGIESGPSAIQLADGTLLLFGYDTTPIAEEPGWRRTTRWESQDNGRTFTGPLTDGRLYLPPDRFVASQQQWFHGNLLQLPDGTLLAAMQGAVPAAPALQFRTYLAQSSDQGKTWQFVSMVAELDKISDPEGRMRKDGWGLWGPCEQTIAHLGAERLLSVARLANDDATPLRGPLSDTYRDLSYTISGAEDPHHAPPATKYFSLGPPSVPLTIAFSADAGKTWSTPALMRQARGMYPRSAVSGDLVALTYGGLSYPRWGNCIVFSTDAGKTWTDEVNFGPFLTTGYTDIVETRAGEFLVVFDASPPQPAVNHAGHWVGVVTIKVARKDAAAN
jgi:hypothetical protein